MYGWGMVLTGNLFQDCVGAHRTWYREVSPSASVPKPPGHLGEAGAALMVTSLEGVWSDQW